MLCEHCSRINLFVTVEEFWLGNGDDSQQKRYFTYVDRSGHHETAEKLHQSVQDGCEFCRVIYDGLESGQAETNDDLWDERNVCYLRYGYNSVEGVLKFEAQWIQAEAEIPRVQTLSFRVYADGDDPSVAQKGIISGRPVHPPDSELSFSLMKRWLGTCIAEHGACRLYPQHSPLPFLPTRLIDVGTDEKPPRLHISSQERGNWIALSHCWGTCSQYVTRENDIEQKKQGIEFGCLPPTFRDAIIVTRRLGCQFLWIDSLCIIQDSHSDWVIESAKMQAYYQQALITLAADRAIGDHEGFLQDHLSVGNSYELPFVDKDGEVKGTFFVGSKHKSPDKQRSPLAQRAWTLQEDWLSMRSIHFCSDQMVWECQEDTLWASDSAPQLILEPPRRQILCLTNQVIRTSGRQQTPTLLWLETVNEYAGRRLTVFSDFFPAISGLARAVRSQSTSEMTYAAGIWLEDWRRGILWSSDGLAMKRKSDRYIAPSWSWGSLELDRSCVGQHSEWWRPYRRLLIHFQDAEVLDSTAILLDCKIEAMDGDVYGRISSGILSLRGRTLHLSSSLRNSYPYYIEWPGASDETNSGLIESKEKDSFNTWIPQRLFFILDNFQPRFPMPSGWADDLLIMDIARMGQRSERQWALVLRPVPASRFYERVGIMNFNGDSGFSKYEAWEVQDIDII